MYENSTPIRSCKNPDAVCFEKDFERDVEPVYHPLETLSQLSSDLIDTIPPLTQLATFLCGYNDELVKLFSDLQSPREDRPSDREPSLNDRIAYLEEKAAIIKKILYKIAEITL